VTAFDYRASPRIFSGRDGHGPLQIVWDTNILIDYLTHGRAMWDGEELEVEDEKHALELEGLQTLVALWQWRDVHFCILPRSITDARRELSRGRRAEFERAVEQFAAALQLSQHEDSWVSERLDVDDAVRCAAILAVPDGADRELVEGSLEIGAHVFLTCDERVLSKSSVLGECGILPARPLDLIVELAACGELSASRADAVPDLQRMTHLIAALPPAAGT
jgi:hypothetical protein